MRQIRRVIVEPNGTEHEYPSESHKETAIARNPAAPSLLPPLRTMPMTRCP